MTIFKKKEGQRGSLEKNFQTMATLPEDYNESIQEAAKKAGVSVSEFKNAQITPAVQREIIGEDV